MEKKVFSKVFDKGFRIILHISLIVYCVSLTIPLFWMLFTAFKSYTEYYSNIFLWPQKWVTGNFGSAIKKLVVEVIRDGKRISYGVLDMAGISLLWATSKSLVHVVSVTFVAYLISRYKFIGRNFIYLLGIFVMVTPIIGNSVSYMVVRKQLGIFNNLFLMALTSEVAAFSGLHFLLLYAAFKRIPESFSEAAFIDGAGHWTVLLRIMIPMMLPLCAVVFVLSFLGGWNDYGTFVIWLPSWPNLAYGMYLFQQDSSLYAGTINEVMAGFALVMIPSIILFLSSQKLIVSKFTVGGLKG